MTGADLRATSTARAATRRRIWLCADDYGISTAVNIAIRDLVVRGRLNAASVLMLAPSCHRSEAILLDVLNSAAPRVAIGLHVTLTSPFRPSSRDFAPLIQGAFMPLAATVHHALLRRFDDDALATEIASQVKKFSQIFGRAPDFIDGHQHVHLLPQIRDAVLRVAKETAPNAWLRQCGQVAAFMVRFADPKGFFLDILSRSFRRRAAALGLRTNPAFAGTYEFAADADFRALFPRFLKGLPDGSVVMCHPGFVDAELQRLDPLTTLREREYAFLASDGLPALLAAHGVALS
jgi:chitin disaccharide deacetylase